MKRLFASLALTTMLVASVEAAKMPAEYFKGQLGGVDYDNTEALKKDIPMAKRVLAECAASKVALERRSCAGMAYYIGSADLAEPLRPYLDDADTKVRREAAQALVLIAREKAFPWIAPLADDPDSFTRASVLIGLSSTGRKNAHSILRRKLEDSEPNVKLQAALLLAADGEEIERSFALAFISTVSFMRSSEVKVKGKALRLLGFAGNEIDLPMLDEILAREFDYNKLDARIARQQLRLKKSTTQLEREQILDESFRDERLRDWVRGEVARRHRIGDRSIRKFVENLGKDANHPGRHNAQGALTMIEKGW